VKLINHTEKPFEYTWDSMHFVVQPGQIIDLPDYQAAIVLKQAGLLDTTNMGILRPGEEGGEGIPTGESRLRVLSEMDTEAVKAMLRFECPYKGAELCKDGPFRTMEELRAHLDVHVGAAATEFDLVAAAPARKK